ncbi:heat-shock protein 70 [Pelomyxa schiedti]|nr:heat-shock protein 70 [Pelomyxa schiedti]
MSAKAAKWATCAAVVAIFAVFVAGSGVVVVDLGYDSVKATSLVTQSVTSFHDVITSETGKRKIPPLVGHTTSGERVAGDTALHLQERNPGRVWRVWSGMVGMQTLECLSQPSPWRWKTAGVVTDSRGLAAFDGSFLGGSDSVILVEEVMASLVNHVGDLTEAQRQFPSIDNCYVIVPPFLSETQEAVLHQAISLSKCNSFTLIPEWVAASLSYAIAQQPTTTTTVAFVDSGAFSTRIYIVEYSPGAQPKILSQEWDLTVSGYEFDQCVTKVAFREHPHPVNEEQLVKLEYAATKTKEALSVSTDAEMELPSDDIVHIKRDDFEQECAHVFSSASNLVAKALHPLKQKVDFVELIGGTSRVPKLRETLFQAFSGAPLGAHLNADEALVQGGAIYAAMAQPNFSMRTMVTVLPEVISAPKADVAKPINLADDKVVEIKKRMQSLADAKKTRVDKEALANEFESLIYHWKHLLHQENVVLWTTPMERRAGLDHVLSQEDWLSTRGEDASSLEFKDRLSQLKQAVVAINEHYTQYSSLESVVGDATLFASKCQDNMLKFPQAQRGSIQSSLTNLLTSAEVGRSILLSPATSWDLVASTSVEIHEKITTLQALIDSLDSTKAAKSPTAEHVGPTPKPTAKSRKIDNKSSGSVIPMALALLVSLVTVFIGLNLLMRTLKTRLGGRPLLLFGDTKYGQKKRRH